LESKHRLSPLLTGRLAGKPHSSWSRKPAFRTELPASGTCSGALEHVPVFFSPEKLY
jgi:hypothetical protein